MDPLLGVVLSLQLLASGERSYLAVPKTICMYPIGISRYCSDARGYMIQPGASINFGFLSTSTSTST